MFRPSSTRVGRRSPRHSARRGAILLVVLTLLALFAVIGLAFVLYAESEANASRIARESVTNTNTTGLNSIDSTQAVNSFLGQFIYSNDDGNSALNGYDMARMIYGSAGNTVPYNGHGVYRETLSLSTLGNPAVDRTQVINFTPLRWSISASGGTETIVYVDPDRTNGNGTVRTAATPAAFLALTPPTHFVARNAAYTYPDRNNAYVAVQDPATGQIVLQSYHRGTLFNDVPALPYDLDPTNKNWMKPHGKFKILRPRTIDQLTLAEIKYLQTLPTPLWPDAASAGANLNAGQYNQLATILTGNDAAANTAVPSFKTLFPYPAANPDGSITGDVQNMKFATGATQPQNYGMQRFDSVWLDAKLPTVTYKGKTLRPMVAATVLPMDGRVNLNVAGNLNGQVVTVGDPKTSGSHQGFGPHEINVGTIMNLNMSGGLNPDLQTMVKGRYNNTPVATVVPNPRGTTNTQQMFYPNPNPLNVANTNFQIYPPTYSQVNFDAKGVYNPPFVAPTDYRSNPNFIVASGSTTPYGNSDPASETTSNPVMFNPYQWDYFTKGTTIANMKQLPISDVRRLQARYSDKQKYLDDYSILGTSILNYDLTNPNNAANSTRALLTPISNRNHRPGLAPNFFGNSPNANPQTHFAYIPTKIPSLGYINPLSGLPGGLPTLDLSTSSTLTDITSTPANRFTGGDAYGATDGTPGVLIQNLRTALSGIDLNQPLPDYRVGRPLLATGQPDLTQVWPMNPVTVTTAQYLIATQARQNLAKAIFDRLIIATGARAYVDPGTGLVTLPDTGKLTYTDNGTAYDIPVNTNDFVALRWLAQLAVNIVDYIDPDDVSTPFVWNPKPGTVFPYNDSYESALPASNLAYRVVFGTEKPRLVINEAYGEIANDQMDMGSTSATKAFRVRFFVELLNPNNKEGTTGKIPGTDDPAIQSALAGPNINALGSVPLRFAAPNDKVSPYRLEIYDKSNAVADEMTPTITPGFDNAYLLNVLGKPSVAPRLKVNLHDLVQPAGAPANLNAWVEPNDGKFSAEPALTPPLRNGFAFIGPQIPVTPTDNAAFVPDTTAGKLYNLMLQKPTPGTAMPPTADNSDQMEYLITEVLPANIPNLEVLQPPPAYPALEGTKKQYHAVLLRRLACPYLPENDRDDTVNYRPKDPVNEYITVDYMTQVKVHDAIKVGKRNGATTGDRMNANLYDPAKHWSIGRVQPFAGYQNNDATIVTADKLDPTLATPVNFSQTLVLGQKPTTPVDRTTTPPFPGSPQLVTFFRMNSRQGAMGTQPAPNTLMDASGNGTDGKLETLLAPFEWLAHLDRKLISPMEVLHVSTAKPFELTYLFAKPAATPSYHQQTLANVAIGASSSTNPNPLYRILEVLQPKPWTNGIAAGSRIPGGININMLWDGGAGRSKVFEALMDKQAVNNFTDSGANNDLTTIWTALKATRSQGWTGVTPTVGVTSDELDASTGLAGLDKPFKGLGVANFTANAGVLTQTDVNSTILRLRSDNKTLFSRDPASVPAVTPGSYADLEPLRKAYNNITTVSDTYMVVFTIGYFETDTTGYPGKELLRREAFNQVPGDLRTQFSAIIDRSALGYDTSGTASTGRPWFTEVSTEANVAIAGSETRQPDNSLTAAVNAGYARYYFRFLSSGTAAVAGSPGTIAVNYEGQQIAVTPQTVPPALPGGVPPLAQLRIGTGLNATTIYIVGLGYKDNPGTPTIDLPAFDPATGLATITFDWPTANGVPQFPIGSAMSGVVIPGHPGAQPGFDYTQYKYKSVVRDFGMLRPNP